MMQMCFLLPGVEKAFWQLDEVLVAHVGPLQVLDMLDEDQLYEDMDENDLKFW